MDESSLNGKQTPLKTPQSPSLLARASQDSKASFPGEPLPDHTYRPHHMACGLGRAPVVTSVALAYCLRCWPM